jgi:hypothetical protein
VGLAFTVACAVNQSECVEALARAGCDIGIKTDEGETGQEIAERNGHKDVVRRLRTLARQPFVGVLAELAGLVGSAEHNGKSWYGFATSASGSFVCSLCCMEDHYA